MSVVVALKAHGTVWFASDSQITSGGSRTSLHNPDNYKIWKVKNAVDCMMGCVGMVREANLLKTDSGLIDLFASKENGMDFHYVVNHLVDNMFKRFKLASLIDEDARPQKMHGNYLIAHKEHVYEIGSTGSVVTIDDFTAIGSGKHEAMGSLVSTVGEAPIIRLVKAIKSSATHDLYVDYPIVVGCTHGKTFLTLMETDDINDQRINAWLNENVPKHTQGDETIDKRT